MEDIKIIPVDSVEMLEARERVSFDIQVATAKKFPRDIERAKNNAIAIATMDKETAESCGYALPRGGKPIQGPSVHLAKIIAQNWGNMRIEAKIIDITSNQIISHAVCFDLENNLAIKVEVRRKITDKFGKRFNDDMITVTGNAANAIALRNAIFAVVPEQITKAAYNASMNLLAGDLTSEEKLIQSRDKALKFFKAAHGVSEEEILKALGIGSINAIYRDQIVLLRNMMQTLKDGDSTVDEMFGRIESKKTPAQKKEDLKTKKENNTQIKSEMP